MRGPRRAAAGHVAIAVAGRVDRLSRGAPRLDAADAPRALAEHVEARGVDGLAGVEGDFVVAVLDAAAREVAAFRSFTAAEQVYFTDHRLSTLLLDHAGGGARPSAAFRLRFVLNVASLQHGMEHTPLEGVRRLLPGHLVTLAPGRAARTRQLVRRRWSYLIDPMQRREEIADAVREALTRAVEDRAADRSRPLYCELSGGLDSSFVACLAGRARADVCAYMFSRPDKASHRSSEAYAREVADRYGIRLTVLAPEDLPRVDLGAALVADEPSDFFWYGRLFGGAAAALLPDDAVLLTGFGADQLFLRSPRVLPLLLARGDLSRFRAGVASVGRLLSRSRASLAWQSALALVPRRAYFAASRPFAGRALNPFATDDVAADRALTGAVDWLRAERPARLRERLEDERAAADAHLVGEGIVCDDLGYLSATRWVDGPLLDPKGVDVASPFCDLALMDLVYDRVSATLVHDFDARYKELLREAQRGVVPESLRARESDTFTFDAARGEVLAANAEALRALLEPPELEEWLDRRAARRALAELEFGVQSSSTRALLALFGYLVWWRDFARAARAVT